MYTTKNKSPYVLFAVYCANIATKKGQYTLYKYFCLGVLRWLFLGFNMFSCVLVSIEKKTTNAYYEKTNGGEKQDAKEPA